jgi:cytochrome c6
MSDDQKLTENTGTGLSGFFPTALLSVVIVAAIGVGLGFLVIHASNGAVPKTSTTAKATTTSTTGASSSASASLTPAETAGEAVFKQNCTSCHTLAAAGSMGTVGPNLDTLKPSDAAVTSQVINGGGAMPAFGKSGALSTTQIKNVATYVSSVAGKG